LSDPVRARPVDAVLRLYQATALVALVAIGILAVYAFQLGPLVGPGVEESFGLSVCLMFLSAALLVHLIDRTYRVWPTGRRVAPPVPGAVRDREIATFLRIVVFLAVAASVAYLLALELV